MRYVVDSSWIRTGSGGRVVIAGSPLRLLRLTAAGARVASAIEAGADVDPSSLLDRLLDAGAVHPVPPPRTSGAAGAERSGFGVDDVTVVTPQLGGRVRDDGRVTVDDGSDPPLAGATVRTEVNHGPAAARNRGRRRVTTDLVAFVDADVDTERGGPSPEGSDPPSAGGTSTEPATGAHDDVGGGPPAWLDALLGHFDDPRVGLVAPRVVGESGSPLDLGDEAALVRAGTRVSYVPSAAIVVRCAALDDVGGFDETLRVGEDVDLVWRLAEAGWRCRYEPRSTVWHEPRSGVRARLAQQVTYGTSAAPLSLRHPHALTPFRSNGWTAASWCLAAVGRPIAAVAVAGASAAALVPKLQGVAATTSLRLATHGHLAAGRQLADAVRRAWWPILVAASPFSRRVRRALAASLVLGARSATRDVAYGVGVWIGMWRCRTSRPIAPTISSWPSRRDRSTAPPS
ncbi:glycosyltransferase family 2 protein [Ilumatobacter sp.]|uniref:glycosyltransferase family 2 protein n=1 Tax=Ilumatobacter sp. TaxID=1967498 RepID=UPI003B52C52B